MPTIREILGLTQVRPYTHRAATPMECADPQLIQGVELEIENVPDWENMVEGIGGMHTTEDGSLRNAGREFITSPATFSVLYYVLNTFFTKNKLTEANYSDRCSVHVHCNVQDLEPKQLSAVLLLYQVYERMLYEFCGEGRDRNVFCVPWSETLLNFSIADSLETDKGSDVLNLQGWQKYTGLNLGRMFDLGTIEFRHMAGTRDINKIAEWLNLIGSLFAYARKNKLEDIKNAFIRLNTTSEYKILTENVFQRWSPVLLQQPHYERALEEGVLNMKYLLMQKSSKAKKRMTILEEMEAIVGEAGRGVGLRAARAGVDLRIPVPPVVAPREAPRAAARRVDTGGIGARTIWNYVAPVRDDDLDFNLDNPNRGL